MRYAAGHLEETRTRIVRSARALFNRHGFDGVSIDDIMAHAGLTRGGFYRHFRRKGELYEAALEDAQKNPLHGLDTRCTSPEIARHLIHRYLSAKQLDDDGACPMVTLPSDVARADPSVKRVFRAVFSAMSDAFAKTMDGHASESARRDRGMVVTALCVGSMVISRALDEQALGERVRAAAKRAAFEMCGWAEDGDGKKHVAPTARATRARQRERASSS